MKLAILSGYNKSLHTIALINELSKIDNVELVLCISVKTFTNKRIKSLLRQYGINQSIRRFKYTFFGKKDRELEKEKIPLKNFLNKNHVHDLSVSDSSKKHKIRHIHVDNLNSEYSIRAIRESNIDLILYSGGGIVRKNLIESSKFGVLNAHSAELPAIRGMNGVEWSLFFNKLPKVSVHMIDIGIDTGDILKTYTINLEESDDINILRGKSALLEVQALVDAVTNFESYYNRRICQDVEAGKQYFTMHPRLKELAEENLKSINAQ